MFGEYHLYIFNIDANKTKTKNKKDVKSLHVNTSLFFHKKIFIHKLFLTLKANMTFFVFYSIGCFEHNTKLKLNVRSMRKFE